jgi:hypothetical protein
MGLFPNATAFRPSNAATGLTAILLPMMSWRVFSGAGAVESKDLHAKHHPHAYEGRPLVGRLFHVT